MGAEKNFFPGGAREKIDLTVFQRLRALEVCDAVLLPGRISAGAQVFLGWRTCFALTRVGDVVL